MVLLLVMRLLYILRFALFLLLAQKMLVHMFLRMPVLKKWVWKWVVKTQLSSWMTRIFLSLLKEFSGARLARQVNAALQQVELLCTKMFRNDLSSFCLRKLKNLNLEMACIIILVLLSTKLHLKKQKRMFRLDCSRVHSFFLAGNEFLVFKDIFMSRLSLLMFIPLCELLKKKSLVLSSVF